MEPFVKGDVVVLPFPFSNLNNLRKRPALVIATLQGDDFIVCQITGESRKDNYSIELKDNNFVKGSLDKISMIRPNKLFTADKSIILYKIGSLNKPKTKEVENTIIDIFKK
jgi:mRNA interferase MazF